MKKFLLFICSVGVIAACNKAEIVPLEENETVDVVNEAVEGSVPVSFIIKGNSMKTRGGSAMPAESELVNVTLKMTGYGVNSEKLFSESIELGEKTDFIVNVHECSNVEFAVFSGPRDENGYLMTLDGQSEYLYAEGKHTLAWDDILAQKSPFELTLARKINKITIEKISVNWTEEMYNSKEFKIRKIYLADVPREIESVQYFYFYSSEFSQLNPDSEKVVRYYNVGGIDDFYCQDKISGQIFYPAPCRLDAQLVNEVDVTISKDNPYTTPHVFYAYLSKSTSLLPKLSATVNKDKGYVLVASAMTTLVIEAEMDGVKMYYRFQVHAPMTDTPLENTHIRFKELTITELGAPTFSSAKTYRNFTYEFKDWIEEEVEGPVESL